MAKFTQGIKLKKQLGQHFLRDQSVVDHMLSKVELNNTTSVFEIGCGDGFLTKSILQTKIARLWIFEIDHEWAEFVKKHYPDSRMTMFETNFLDIDFKIFEENKPWTLLANLPYQVTFPILKKLQQNRHLLKEGVIMVQEEVAEKILKKSGRGYGYISLFFQHYFEWVQLVKVPPTAFVPPPKVYSRLLYFKPRLITEKIINEDEFWKFIKFCFKQPRRTLKNNLQQTHFDLNKIKPDLLNLRAQQLSMNDLIEIWNSLQSSS
ncbi:16S rRNA (adenine(1518)-N(6)/adenine(1519)-N(6))-dimethyltransferase RsmA [Candidatus Dependentiae bacterium]|nr:16S rRNA (adenine(1518)-N(6)/adenine(1519)-N(6))-dimethyltransferase RsmA [Candidatus Dependentiae bacterium]